MPQLIDLSNERITRESNTALGRLIRERRAELGISQNQLATRTRLDHSFISRVESGERDMSRSHIPALAAVLDMHPDELLIAAGYLPIRFLSYMDIGHTTAREIRRYLLELEADL